MSQTLQHHCLSNSVGDDSIHNCHLGDEQINCFDLLDDSDNLFLYQIIYNETAVLAIVHNQLLPSVSESGVPHLANVLNLKQVKQLELLFILSSLVIPVVLSDIPLGHYSL